MSKNLNTVLGLVTISCLILVGVVGFISANGVLAAGIQKHAATPAQLEAVGQAWFSITKLSMGCFSMAVLVTLVLFVVKGGLRKFPAPLPPNWGVLLVVAMVIGLAFSLILAQRLNQIEPGQYSVKYQGREEIIVYGRTVWVDRDYFLRLKRWEGS